LVAWIRIQIRIPNEIPDPEGFEIAKRKGKTQPKDRKLDIKSTGTGK
jgi:hypothetical protein